MLKIDFVYLPCAHTHSLACKVFQVVEDYESVVMETKTAPGYVNPWYQRCVCCTALMRPNQVETVLSAVAYSLVAHDDYCHWVVWRWANILCAGVSRMIRVTYS